MSKAVFLKRQHCDCGGGQRIGVPGALSSSCCLTWSCDLGLMASGACFTVTVVRWWWAVTAVFTWPFSTILLDMLKFLKLGSEVCRNSLRALSLATHVLRPTCDFLVFTSSPSHFLLLLLFCPRETTPLGNCLKPTQSGYLQLACAQRGLSVSCKHRAIWIKLLVRKRKYSLIFITEEMEHLNAALCYINICTRENTLVPQNRNVVYCNFLFSYY